MRSFQLKRGRHTLVRLAAATLAGALAGAGSVRAQTLNQELPKLAERITKVLVAQNHKSIAAIDFTDLQGRTSELGRYLAERLVGELVMTGGVSVADRANIRNIVAEHKLMDEGIVSTANARKLREFAGVEAILTGTLAEAAGGWELLVKAISTESARIVAADRITFPMTIDSRETGNRDVTAGAGSATSAARVRATIERFDLSPDGRRASLALLLENTNRDRVSIALDNNGQIGTFAGPKVTLTDDRATTWYIQSVVGLTAVPCCYQSLSDIRENQFTTLRPAERVRLVIVFNDDNGGVGTYRGYNAPGAPPPRQATSFSFAAEAIFYSSTGSQRFSIQLPTIRAPR